MFSEACPAIGHKGYMPPSRYASDETSFRRGHRWQRPNLVILSVMPYIGAKKWGEAENMCRALSVPDDIFLPSPTPPKNRICPRRKKSWTRL